MQMLTKSITTKAKPAKVLYPDPDKHPKSLNWLAYFFRDCAELQALENLVKEKHPHTTIFDIRVAA